MEGALGVWAGSCQLLLPILCFDPLISLASGEGVSSDDGTGTEADGPGPRPCDWKNQGNLLAI